MMEEFAVLGDGKRQYGMAELCFFTERVEDGSTSMYKCDAAAGAQSLVGTSLQPLRAYERRLQKAYGRCWEILRKLELSQRGANAHRV